MFSCNEEKFDNELSNATSHITKSAGDGKYDLLGYGYDCTFSDFKGSLYSKARIIDLEKFKSGNGKDAFTGESKQFFPGTIEEAILHSGETTSSWGFNLNEYKEKVASQNNVSMTISNKMNVKLFSAELKSFFENSSHFSSSESFYRMNAKRYTRKITMSNVYPTQLKYFLTDEFINDLKNSSGEQLVNKYGTHVLTDILLGGVGSCVFNAKIINQTNETKFKNEVSLFFKIITTYSSLEEARTTFKDIKDINIFIQTYGGSGTIGENVSYDPMTGELNGLTFNYQSWLNSINKTTEEIIGIGNNTTKICLLSEFIDDPSKKKEVEDAILAYCESQEIKMNNTPNFSYEKVNISCVNDVGIKKYLVVQSWTGLNGGSTSQYLQRLPTLENMKDGSGTLNFNGQWTFLPYGKYFRIHVTRWDKKQKYLTKSGGFYLEDFNESSIGQLWEIEPLENGKYMFRNVETNLYLRLGDKDRPKNPNDSFQHFSIELDTRQ